MHGETTECLRLVLCTFLEIDLGFCGSLVTASSYNKDKPWRHHYSVSNICVLSLFMNFEINLLIVCIDIKVAGHNKQLAESGPCLARPWLLH